MTQEKKVRRILRFAKTLVGKRYKWWTPKVDMTADSAPFWATNDSLPKKVDALACTGLLNLIMRYLGKPVPGTERRGYKSPGGTGIWFYTLKKKGVLQKFDPSTSYPEGTLLLRDYHNDNDQGHVAVVLSHQRGIYLNPLLSIRIRTDRTTRRGGLLIRVLLSSPLDTVTFLLILHTRGTIRTLAPPLTGCESRNTRSTTTHSSFKEFSILFDRKCGIMVSLAYIY